MVEYGKDVAGSVERSRVAALAAKHAHEHLRSKTSNTESTLNHKTTFESKNIQLHHQPDSESAREHKLCNKHYAVKTLHNQGRTLAKDLAKEALAAATLDTQTQKTLVYKPHDWRGAAVHALGEHRELVTSSSMSRVRMLRFSITIDAWM